MLPLVIALQAAAAPLDLSNGPHATPIVGGDVADDPLFDSVVALQLPLNKSCSGVLVAPSLVLTAAHCVADVPDTAEIDVAYGDDAFGTSVSAVAWGHDEDRYCPMCTSDRFDVGWVAIDTPLMLAEGYPRPISVQGEWDAVMRAGTLISVAGFGATVAGGGSDGIKRAVALEITKISDGGIEFFAGGEGRDSCDGDSGGPALTRLANGQIRLAGLVSRGPENCGVGGIYATPYPALCTVREDTDVDLTSPGCGECDCIDLHTQDEGGCRIADDDRSGWATLLLVAVAWRRRRRAEAQPGRACVRARDGSVAASAGGNDAEGNPRR